MYAMVCTKLNIAYVVGVISHFLSNSEKQHWKAIRWIMSYLRGNSKLKFCFGSDTLALVGYTDSYIAGNVDTRKSTSSYIITNAGRVVSWQFKLQKCVPLFITETKFIAITEIYKELL